MENGESKSADTSANFNAYERNHGIENHTDKDRVPLDDIPTEPIPEGNLTAEDLEALGPRDLSMDMGADEELKHRVNKVDFGADEMDVPGTEADDVQEEIGSEDEENNYYSLGGDRHEDAQDDNPDIVI